MLNFSYEWIDWHKAMRDMQLGPILVIGSIAWGFWSYSAAGLSRTPSNEGYIDG